jgi:hypothetical protein
MQPDRGSADVRTDHCALDVRFDVHDPNRRRADLNLGTQPRAAFEVAATREVNVLARNHRRAGVSEEQFHFFSGGAEPGSQIVTDSDDPIKGGPGRRRLAEREI